MYIEIISTLLYKNQVIELIFKPQEFVVFFSFKQLILAIYKKYY